MAEKFKKDPCGGSGSAFLNYLDNPKDFEFQFWLRLSEKLLRHLRRTRVAAVWRFLCDNKAYPSLDFDLD